MPERPYQIKIGTRLGTDLTVLGVVEDRGKVPVYLVWHHRSWCPMACKVFESQEQAEREANIMLALAHPFIVRCLGISGTRYLLMEYLEGPSLYQLTKTRPKQRLDIADALRMSIYIGAALSHIHDHGLLHLDVKPSNIIVVGGRPVLCDFGIARWQNEARPEGVAGTDSYVAPEECLLKEMTSAADVFGLGVTLYGLLTGALPFPKKGEGMSYPQTTQSPTSARRHRATVPAGLDKLVLSCLARDPQARPELETLLPSLNGYIARGPLMWPIGFHPEKHNKVRKARTN